MPVFSFRDNDLFMEDVSLNEIATHVGTPVYCYSENGIRNRFLLLKKATERLKKSTVCFAVKSNSNLAILSLLAHEGAGADVVSGNEMLLAMKAGIDANKIVFSGVGKSPEDLHEAVRSDIKMINLESYAEAVLLNDISKSYGKKTAVAVRVNPDVDAKTHEKITTGKKENKFGLTTNQALDLFEKIKNMDGLRPIGIDVHIGSQLLSLEPFEKAFAKTAEFIDKIISMGIDIRVIDVGGGLGVRYTQNDTLIPVDDYIETVQRHLGRFRCEFVFEPGRFIVAEAGVLMTRVLYIKETDEKSFAIVDAGMNNLIRPALYDAFHDIITVKKSETDEQKPYDVVGPVCESSDVFGKARLLPSSLAQGDLLVIKTAGAYGETMQSHYNMHPCASAVLINNDQYDVIRKPQSLDEMIADQKTARWQQR